jgi:hypothetical protein
VCIDFRPIVLARQGARESIIPKAAAGEGRVPAHTHTHIYRRRTQALDVIYTYFAIDNAQFG